ncbi:MAG: hypothetical protein UR66_C0005G0056 [Candidatus Moranbacteria bacterium GW2011_GWE1_35_17]|nr:MAG: hypothetical protein UR66_C0005G0056 [Candidatus Moranbacteria bacterium GW2011_GWE1_35_17]KKP82696.1 MAG: hypothetical protein UR82_C0035G0012 [Candidatus Moranbacteria bacterium GW2011_GWF1_35_5]
MSKKTLPKNRLGASTEHSRSRLLRQCNFEGTEGDARKFLAKCRRAAGRDKVIAISAKNLGISPREMHGVEDDKYFVSFHKGKAPTVLQFVT